jgi:hypothetical protein
MNSNTGLPLEGNAENFLTGGGTIELGGPANINDANLQFQSGSDIWSTGIDASDTPGARPYKILRGANFAGPGGIEIQVDGSLTTPFYTTIGDVLTIADGSGTITTSTPGAADVVSIETVNVDNSIVRFDGTGGKTIQKTSVGISDTNDFTGVGLTNGYDLASTDRGKHTGTGLTSGGVLSVNVDTTKFDITDGTGTVTDPATGVQTIVTWTGLTGQIVTYVGFVTYVGLNSAGTVVSKATPFSRIESRDYILLGTLFHVFNNTNLDTVQQMHTTLIGATNQIRDIASVLGKINVSGNITSFVTTDLTIIKSSGELFEYGSNHTVDPKDPHVSAVPTVDTSGAGRYSIRMQDGTSSGLLTDIDPNIFDDGTAYPGSTYTNNRWGVQRVYQFTTGDVVISPPQQHYATSEAAISGIAANGHTVIPALSDQLLISYIVVRGAATDLSSSGDALFIQTSKFGTNAGSTTGGTQSLQSVYNNSPTPEILTDGSRLALTVQIASGADTDTGLEVKNTAGTTTFSVAGDGDVIISKDLQVNGSLLVTNSAGLLMDGDITMASGSRDIGSSGTPFNEIFVTDVTATNVEAGATCGAGAYEEAGISGLLVRNNIGSSYFVGAGAGNTGTNSVFVGANAGTGSTGTSNTAVGVNAGDAITTGMTNTCIGSDSDADPTSNNQTAIGNGATCTTDNEMVLGNASLTTIRPMNQTTCFLGSPSKSFATVYANSASVNDVVTTTINTIANNFLGNTSMAMVTTGNSNTAIGPNVLEQVTTGNVNVGLGNNVLQLNLVGNNNIGVGNNVLPKATNNNNIAIGTGGFPLMTTGIDNTGMGTNAGLVITTGSDNVMLGHDTEGIAAGDNQIAIGKGATCTAANEMVLGNASLTAIRGMGNGTADLGNASFPFKHIYGSSFNIGAAFSGNRLYMEHDVDATFTQASGVLLVNDNTQDTNGSNGIEILPRVGITNGSANGINISAHVDTAGGTRNASILRGIITNQRNRNAGTVTNCYGVYSNNSNDTTTGTITNSYNYYATQLQSTGTMTNAYGYYCNDFGTTFTTQHAFYAAGASDLNFFNGNTGIGGAANASQVLTVAGNGHYEGTGTVWIDPSDQRIKKNIVDKSIDVCLSTILGVRVREFAYTDEHVKTSRTLVKDKIRTGIIAQELESVAPECISTSDESFSYENCTEDDCKYCTGKRIDENTGESLQASEVTAHKKEHSVVTNYTDFKSFDMGPLLFDALGAIQSLHKKIEALETRITVLEA